MAAQAREQAPGLGALTVNGQKNGADHIDRLPTHAANFVNGERFTILPAPYGDAYLGYLSLFVAGHGEIAITPKLPKGLREHYEQIGILEPGQLVEVPHIVENGDMDQGNGQEERPFAFPHGDVLARMARQINEGSLRRDTRNSVLLPTIIGDAVRAQAEQLDMATLDTPSSDLTNNKQYLREFAEAHPEYGITMMPGIIVSGEMTRESIDAVIDQLKKRVGDMPFGAWVKLPGGSGGDTVIHIDEITPKAIQDAVAEMHARFDESAELRAARNLEDTWAADHFAPNGGGTYYRI